MSRHAPRRRRPCAACGFSLVELMLVLTIIAVLTRLAWPSYAGYVQRAHRADARNALLQAALWMERAATASGSYPVGRSVPADVTTVQGGRYTLTVTSPDTAQTNTSQSYRVLATRSPGSGQSNDACGDFSIDQANRRQVQNNRRGTDAAVCWNQ